MTSEPAEDRRDPGAVDPRTLSLLLVAVGTSRSRPAFAELFRYFAPRVKGYLVRLGGDRAAAEELTQETMVNVWRKADRYDPQKASPATWIFTIARNIRIDAYRRQSHPQIDEADPLLVPDPIESPDTAVIRYQDAVRVGAAIAGLSEPEQEVLRLAFFDGLSHSSVAEQLGLPLGTVKSRIRLAFAKLRITLGEEGVAP